MNSKIFKSLAVAALAASVTLTAVFAGCGGGDYNNEEDPLTFSTQPLDEMFNPFYSTSGTDSSIVGMTQIGMLGNDKDGNETYGPDEAVLALDYEERSNGGKKDVDLQTTYYFVLKNDVKFSDGTPVTMKDVLFNLYEYLDPAYYGSATIYSTDIVGLKKYRTQQEDENEQDNADVRFENEAAGRINRLRQAVENIYKANQNKDNLSEAQVRQRLSDSSITDIDASYTQELLADYDKALELYKEEIDSDWSVSRDTYKDHTETDKEGKTVRDFFTTDVEMFLYNEGVIYWDKKEGKMVSNATTDYTEVRTWTEQKAKDYVYEGQIPYHFTDVITYMATAINLNTYLVSSIRGNYFEENEDAFKFHSIDGIKFANRTEAVTVNGTSYRPMGTGSENYNADGSPKEGFNEVLSITINNIDPKAKWNFALGVAPMSYYSSAEEIAKFDYVNNFGVKYASADFQDKVVKAPEKNGVPKGAGPYAASCAAGGLENITADKFFNSNIVYFERNPYYNMGAGKDGVALIKKVRYQVAPSSGLTNSLYTGEIDFVTPNAKKETVDELKTKKEEGIEYKEVKNMGYGYIGVNASKVPSIYVRRAIMYAINTQACVDYYQSGASLIYRSMSTESWAYPQGCDAYYPYIGGAVPGNLNVVDPDYKAYVDSKGKKSGDMLTEEEQREFIISLLRKGGYSGNYDRNTFQTDGTAWSNGSDTLRYTFTIVGSETDHPAWNAMLQAGQFLDKCGFSINTTTDPQGLKKLNNGDLAVWAAAWGSTIDPDMYQVYHIESRATSVNNWGYNAIKLNREKYSTEYEIITRLSELIDEGRETNDKADRADIYSDALDVLMELAVELPTYQRTDLFAWNDNKIDSDTFNQDVSSMSGLTADLQNVSLRIK